MKNSSGFSLAEILVAAGLLGIVAVGVININKQMNQGMKTGELRFDKMQTQKEILQVLSDTDSCTQTFSGINAKTGSVSDIKDGSGNIKFQINEKTGIQNLEIANFTLSDSHSSVSVVSPGMGDTHLNIQYKGKNGTTGGNKSGKIKLKVETDASDNILTCYALSSGNGGLWMRSSTDYDSIYYNGNGVGVNTSDPVAELDVNGSIKIGNTTAPCDSTTQGSLRYDNTIKALLLCHENVWRKVLLQDPYVWVNTSTASASQSSVCSGAGFSAATNQGYGICASGENRPISGDNHNSITYTHGMWGGVGNGGTIHSGNYCYHGSQVQDSDGTDILVAWLCKRY